MDLLCHLTKDALYGAVDPNAIRPLVVGKMENGAYILASETCAIDVLGAEFIQDIHAGEYVVITDEGIEVKTHDKQQLQFQLWNIFILRDLIQRLQEKCSCGTKGIR